MSRARDRCSGIDVEALKNTLSPTPGAAGENVNVAVGAEAPAAVTVTVLVTFAVWAVLSVTTNATVNAPGLVNVWLVELVAVLNNVPSPKFQAYEVSVRPVAAVDPAALKKTTWPTTGAVGELTNAATVAPPPPPPPPAATTGTALVTVVAWLASSVTVSVTLNVPADA